MNSPKIVDGVVEGGNWTKGVVVYHSSVSGNLWIKKNCETVERLLKGIETMRHTQPRCIPKPSAFARS